MGKKLLSIFLISSILTVSSVFTTKVQADTSTVVTIGADLSSEQKEIMYKYFNITPTSVPIIEIKNLDERKYLEGIATNAQIGRKTYSCAYIEPTKQGSGINVKIANLTWVNSNMIASTLSTAGIYDCNVVAAAPFAVSGTGSLTGVYVALDSLGFELSEEKKDLATEELIITGNLAEEIGTDEATGIIADIKNTIIAENIVVADEIETVIIDSSKKFEVTLTDQQIETIAGMMQKIAEQDYDYSRLQSTLESITEKTSQKLGIALEEASSFFEKVLNVFKNIVNWFVQLFTKQDSNDTTSSENLGILTETNDDLLGENAIINATNDDVTPENSQHETDDFVNIDDSSTEESSTNDTSIDDSSSVENSTDDNHMDENNSEFDNQNINESDTITESSNQDEWSDLIYDCDSDLTISQ